jgi:hypothetical protein
VTLMALAASRPRCRLIEAELPSPARGRNRARAADSRSTSWSTATARPHSFLHGIVVVVTWRRWVLRQPSSLGWWRSTFPASTPAIFRRIGALDGYAERSSSWSNSRLADAVVACTRRAR